MNLNTYRRSPKGHRSILELEDICRRRLKLYVLLEEAKNLSLEVGSSKWSQHLKEQLKISKLNLYYTLLQSRLEGDVLKAKKENTVAHWTVGLCYSQTEELQKHFIDWELQWFHLLFINCDQISRETFLKKNNLICETMNPFSCFFLQDKELIQSTDVNYVGFDTVFYKASFYDVPQVVGKRIAIVEKGKAIFSEQHLIHFVKIKLRKEFMERLQFQNKVLPGMKENICHLVDSVPPFLPKLKLVGEVDGINLENLDHVAKNHFPLCMRHLHNTLRTKHHLKYDAKMQYGIFLYWLGLPYEDAMTFWKDEFTQTLKEDVYDKKYVYLFKHQYGQVGRKSPYDAQSCRYILDYQPLPLQHHGCPFKHWSKPLVLDTIGKEVSNIKDIEDLMDQGEYQKACTKFLCCSKNILIEEGGFIQSPNEYFAHSINSIDILEKCFVDNNE